MKRRALTRDDIKAACAKNRDLAALNPGIFGQSPAPAVAETAGMTPNSLKTGVQALKRKIPAMNKTEAEYALILEAMKRRGDIQEFAFEPVSLRYGTKAFYTPDFVIKVGGKVSVAELKQVCEASAMDTLYDTELRGIIEWLRAQLPGFLVVEIKGGFVYPEAKPRFKAAQDRHKWGLFSMIQKQKGRGFVQIL